MGCQPRAHTEGDREVIEASEEGTVQRRGHARVSDNCLPDFTP